MTDSLIEKLEAKWKPAGIGVGAPLVRLDEVIEIICQHTAAQGDMVSAVKELIDELAACQCGRGSDAYFDFKKEKLAAMNMGAGVDTVTRPVSGVPEVESLAGKTAGHGIREGSCSGTPANSSEISVVDKGMCNLHPRYNTYPFCPDCQHEKERKIRESEEYAVIPVGPVRMKHDNGIATGWSHRIRKLGDRAVVTVTYDYHEGPTWKPSERYEFALPCVDAPKPVSIKYCVGKAEIEMFEEDADLCREQGYTVVERDMTRIAKHLFDAAGVKYVE